MCRIKIIVSSLVFLLSVCPPAFAVMDINSDTPIYVSAQKMVSHDKEKAVVFTGQVRAKQGDMIINADVMTIFHGATAQKDATDEQKDSPQIDKIIATGNVEIIQEGFVATGDEVEYLASTEVVTLTGHAKIIQDNNMVTGYQVAMDLAKGTTTVTPQQCEISTETGAEPVVKPKVEMYFYPKSDKDEKK